MLDGLGASWYSNGSYEEAVRNFCEASDLNPDDPNPYLLMGEMLAAETTPSPEMEERLARFVRLQPGNAWANYYYAVSLQKRWSSPDQAVDVDQVKSLLQTAVQLDPKLGVAYLQLGILYSKPEELSAGHLCLAKSNQSQSTIGKGTLPSGAALSSRRRNSESAIRAASVRTDNEKKTEEARRQRHELQQFVYELRDSNPPHSLNRRSGSAGIVSLTRVSFRQSGRNTAKSESDLFTVRNPDVLHLNSVLQKPRPSPCLASNQSMARPTSVNTCFRFPTENDLAAAASD